MDFDTFYHKLDENIDTSNYVEKYRSFGQKLIEKNNLSSHEDTFLDLKMASYYSSGILYRFFFKTINKDKTLKKILKLVSDKIFEIKTITDNSSNYIVVEVVYLFKYIDKILQKQN